jgi:exopolysaccharide biosynthesis polyprenyl glycosylphosphotransferase
VVVSGFRKVHRFGSIGESDRLRAARSATSATTGGIKTVSLSTGWRRPPEGQPRHVASGPRPWLTAVDLATRPPTARHTWQRTYARALIGADLVLCFVASAVAFVIRFGQSATGKDWAFWYYLLTAAWPFLMVGSLALSRVYEARFVGSGAEEYRRIGTATLRVGAFISIAAVALKFDVARGYIVLALPLALALCLLTRVVGHEVLARLRRREQCLNRLVIVGRERSVAELMRAVRGDAMAGYQVVAVCLETDNPRCSTDLDGVPVYTSADVLTAIREAGADTIAITAFTELDNRALRQLGWDLEGSNVAMLIAPRIADVAGPRIHVRPVGGLPLLHVEEPELVGSRRVAKAALDRSVAAVMLVLLAPLLTAIGLVVRLTSSGPAIFKQTRVGTHGETFTLWKFRSMRVTAEEELAALTAQNKHGDGPLFKLDHDPRITPVGRWLRRLSLDELPQLFQVLTGRMSLVGPRPPLPAEVSRYANEVHRRLLVKPGLTGLWQISGRSNLTWEDTVRLDLHYVENWSLGLDLSILARTAWAVAASRGAY